jgi:AhpD family alkylhydroperoxidase
MTTPVTQPRLDYRTASPEGLKAMMQLQHVVHTSGLDAKMIELVKLRASQMNGCAFCIDMHSKDARSLGETEQRIYGLSAWKETNYYTEHERAALAWTEALTNIQDGHAPDEVYSYVSQHFNAKDLMNLTLAITTINAWNRIALGFRVVPGSYQVAAKH